MFLFWVGMAKLWCVCVTYRPRFRKTVLNLLYLGANSFPEKMQDQLYANQFLSSYLVRAETVFPVMFSDGWVAGQRELLFSY